MKLDIFDERYVYYVAWCDDVDGEGGRVGQDHEKSEKELREHLANAKDDRSESGFDRFEYLSVEIAAKSWVKAARGADKENTRAGKFGIEFDSLSTAKRFLAAMRAAVKAAKSEYDTGVPWPEWAKLASAAGWKPPKGWKP